MKTAQHTDKLPVRRKHRKDSLSPWDHEIGSSPSPLKLTQDRNFTELNEQTTRTITYPIAGGASTVGKFQKERSFMARKHRPLSKPSARCCHTSNNDSLPHSDRRKPQLLKIKEDPQNISTMESQVAIDCRSIFPTTGRSLSLPVSKQDIQFELANSKEDARVVLVNVDKYLADYKARGRLNQMFLENYHHKPEDRPYKRTPRADKSLTNAQPKFSRRDWRNRRNIQFYLI